MRKYLLAIGLAVVLGGPPSAPADTAPPPDGQSPQVQDLSAGVATLARVADLTPLALSDPIPIFIGALQSGEVAAAAAVVLDPAALSPQAAAALTLTPADRQALLSAVAASPTASLVALLDGAGTVFAIVVADAIGPAADPHAVIINNPGQISITDFIEQLWRALRERINGSNPPPPPPPPPP
ncbi:MAG: hypothetical protein IBJ11_08145, partial [Phycisphaerales bacterium]|nr:hypothetical protein [Phycisphaerales bacterium]